jgi:hypothetical protein
MNIQKVQEHLGGKYYANELVDWVTYPTEGDFAGKVFLRIPGDAVYDGNTGCVSLYLFYPKLENNYGYVRVGIGYIPSSEGGMEQLKAGDYSDVAKDRWVNMTSGYINLSLLFHSCIAEDAHQSIYNWVARNAGCAKQFALKLPADGEFLTLLWDTVISTPEQVNKTGRSFGESYGLALDKPWFENATERAKGAQLMYAPSAGYVNRPFSELRPNNGSINISHQIDFSQGV